MAKKVPKPPAYARLHAIIGLETVARVDEARAALKRQGVHVSNSGFVEVALLELLGRHDLAGIMRKHRVRARRD
jgi:hypothetical protein